MSALFQPNLHVKGNSRLQESYLVKRQKLERKRLEESKDLADRIHPEDEEYSAPEVCGE